MEENPPEWFAQAMESVTSVLSKWYYAVPIYFVIVIIVFVVCWWIITRPFHQRRARSAGAPETSGVPAAAVVVGPRLSRKFKDVGDSEGTTSCTICLDEFEDEDRVDTPFHCKHVFHRDCIDLWIGNSFSCPICRSFVKSILRRQ
ncbi:PREDICTED: RING-H2 finger protein ATL39-like [Tarenaya hassleriana]|uniref:RING-H2 finger protein ATL39-like n=1 Tax=Tarenaya hassleriana TaxID=28532 RepID=UPI00053C5F53|nr:PREDICTED: RING-H2 finger protein ATL39-like [Tarenaya hassleriana]